MWYLATNLSYPIQSSLFQLIKTKNKRKYWKEEYLIPTIIELGIVIAILFVGAIIEWQMVQQMVRLG